MILVTGAAGKTGGAVTSELIRRGEDVKVFVRNSGQADSIKGLGVNDVFIGDLLNQDDLIKSCSGVSAVYHLCPNMHSQEVQIGQNVIKAAVESGLSHFVYHSVLHPQIEAMPHHWNKMRVEEMLLESGIPFTILQPTAYMQNILGRLDEIRDQRKYRVPYRVEATTSLVDLMDVAEVAANALTDPKYEGGIFELVGEEQIDQVAVAEALSGVLGYPIQAEEIPLQEWQTNAESAGLGEYAIDTLSKMFRHYDQYNLRGNSKVIEFLLGRKPITIKQFLERELK